MARLKPFSLDAVFSPEKGREDKIVMMLGYWDVEADSVEFDVFQDHLSGPPMDCEELAFSEDDLPEHGWLFCRPADRGRYRNQLKIRKQALWHPEKKKVYRSPLCAGWIQFKRIPNELRTKFPQGRRLQLHLSLNLLRFIRHQPKKPIPINENDWPPSPRITARKEDRSSFKSEVSFDGEDNWLPDEKIWNSSSTPQKCREHLRQYVDKIMAVFCRNLKRASKVAGVENLKRTEKYHSLKSLEVAWEFASDNPLLDAAELGRLAVRAASRSKERHYQFKMGETGRRINSTSFSVSLAEDIELRIYAKTNKRIRFEVVQNNLWKKWSPLLREARLRRIQQKGIYRSSAEAFEQSRSLDVMMLILEELRRKAAGELNSFMVEMRNQKQEASRSRPLIDLLGEISSAIPEGLASEEHASIMRGLLLLLCHGRKIVGGLQKTAGLAATQKRLKKRGVIAWSMKRRAYMLAPHFAGAADCLESLDGDQHQLMWGGGY